MEAFIDEGRLVCPNCGGSYLHQGGIDWYTRESEEDTYGFHFRHHKAGFIQPITPRPNILIDHDMSCNPSERRDGLRIYFECEDCSAAKNNFKKKLVIFQHKGQTFVEWE